MDNVLDKTLMPGNIDETEAQFRRQLMVGEAQVDSDTAAFFFGQAVASN